MAKASKSESKTSYQEELWNAADKLRAQSSLKTNEFSTPVLGLIFLKYADWRFEKALEDVPQTRGRSAVTLKDHIVASGALYIPEKARYKYLLNLPESENIAKAVNDAMSLIENENSLVLAGVLYKNYQRLGSSLLRDLLKKFNNIDISRIKGDAFGKIYEYFLGKFASAEGQRGGEFYTPTSLVRLIVEILKPIRGNVYDPACGSGGMFVQSSEFIKRTQKDDPNELIRVYGQEKVEETAKLCKMNLAVHGLEGKIVTANTMERDASLIPAGKDDKGQDIYTDTYGKMDFVMANPPFNVSGVDKEKIKNDKRYALGLPKVDNANYLWIQCFYSALSKTGRAGFVMPNSASDARQSEQTIREKIIKANAVDVMVSVGSNMFHNVTLPCTLWFLDKGKKDTERKDKVLFLDVREIYNQVDKAHREFTEEQIEFITNIVKLYRGEEPCFVEGSQTKLKQYFPDLKYKDVKGLCKVATIEEIEKQGWSLNSGRYVGVSDNAEEEYVFEDKLKELNAEFEKLNNEAHILENNIALNVKKLLGA